MACMKVTPVRRLFGFMLMLTFIPAGITTGQGVKIEPDHVITYKKVGDTELKLHIFNPPQHDSAKKLPAMVFIHGGAWSSGTPTWFYRQSAHLANRGMVAISVEYRVRKSHGTSPRECVKDGKSAMRWVKAHALELGIDPERILAGGGSAGGHIAAATATLKGLDEEGEDTSISCRPVALVLFNPVYDNGPGGYGFDRVGDYWKEISPLHNMDESIPPSLVMLGTKDKLVPVETAKEWQAKSRSFGVRSDLILYEGQPHAFFNKAKFTETLQAMDDFLVSLGYLDPLSED